MSASKKIYQSNALWLITVMIVFFTVSACAPANNDDSNTETTNPTSQTLTLGAKALGIALTGPLAGKEAYFLTSEINIENCWVDSVNWTPEGLLFGVTSINFTKLLAGAGLHFNGNCTLPSGQMSDNFDTYLANFNGSNWDLNNQSMNGAEDDAAASISGDTMAFIIFHAPPKYYDIYLANRTAPHTWSNPVSWEHNSICKEDNPHIYANGTKMVFESQRDAADGSSCESDTDSRAIWFSKILPDNSWSMPVKLPSSVNALSKNTQPWIDEANGYLYWTADKDGDKIRRIKWVADTPIGTHEDVISPSISGLSDGSADGKIVFVGEYSHSDEYVFFGCALASLEGDGSDPELFLGKWKINIKLCTIPL